jgi:hypothetical protein
MRFMPEPDWMLEAQLAMRAKINQFDEPCLIIVLAAFGGYRYAASNRASKGHASLIQVSDPKRTIQVGGLCRLASMYTGLEPSRVHA